MTAKPAPEIVSTILHRVDAIGPVIRDGAAEAEQLGRLTPPIVDALHATGIFRLFVPVEHGGEELTLPESVEVFEHIGSMDGASAWTSAILAGGFLLARCLPSEFFASVCAESRALIAATLNPTTMRAEQIGDHYRFSGRATYVSGSAHATWMIAAAAVTRGGKVVFVNDAPQIRAGLLPMVAARSLDTWRVTGMRGTGSNDFEIDDVEVAAELTFAPFQPMQAKRDDVFSAIPLWPQLGLGLSATGVGIAANMVERFVELASSKVPVGGNMSRLAERASAQIAVGEAQGLYQAARAVLLDSASETWHRGLAGHPFDDRVLARLRLGSVTAVRLAAQAIDLLHDAAGMDAVAADSVLDRCWRDIHTLTQHVLMTPARFEVTGRVLLGLDSGVQVI